MQSWNSARNILCIRLDAMGDVIMTTPALKMLKEAVPGRKLTLLTSTQGSKIAESIPLFDDVIPYPAPWLKASGDRTDDRADLQMIENLQKQRFDGAVIFTVYSQNPLPSALLCHLANIPLRAAYCRENPYALLTDWIQEEEPHKLLRHEVRRHLDLVSKIGCSSTNLPLVLQIHDEARESLSSKLARVNALDDKRRIIIHPGSTAESRRYSEDGFAKVADTLSDMGLNVLFTGSEEENELVKRIQGKMKNFSWNLAGVLSLKEMIALLGSSPLLISNNSGPVHMAAALGTPVVVLYALTNPQHTPWLIPNAVLFKDVHCRFCYKSVCPAGTKECLDSVRPELIVAKAMELLHKEEAPSYDFLAIHPIQLKEEVHHDHATKSEALS
ncbi:MAG: lipopolysaccharide heptosyltransferase II [Bacteriovoracia bacterium]